MRKSRIAALLGIDGAKTIQFRILALVLSMAVPLVCLSLWVAVRLAAAKTELIEAHRLGFSQRVSMTVDREVASTIGMLTGLAGADDLVTANYTDFTRHAQTLLLTRSIVAIWAFDRGGAPLLPTLTPPSAGARQVIVKHQVERVFAGHPTASGVSGTGTAGTTAIIAVPARDGAGVAYGIAAEIRVADLSRLFAQSGMASHWVAAIVDRNGRFVARSLDHDRWLGQSARPELVETARSGMDIGTFDNDTYEGVSMRNSFQLSPLTDWLTVVAVPRTELNAPLRRAIMLVLLGGLVILSATLATAMWFARQISEPVRDLSRFAHALANGTSYPITDDDIIELVEVRQALEHEVAGSARLAAIVASSGDAIISIDVDDTIRTWNKGAEELFGYTADEIIGKPKTIILPADRVAEFEAHKKRILAGESIRCESTRRKRNGTVFQVSIDAAPIRHPDGTIIAISSIHHDISERHLAEVHKNFLMGELAHRSKNQLAIIQSIANQTSRRTTNLADFLATFRQRLQGLAASHDLLTSQGWGAVELSQLIDRQLAVFTDVDSSSIRKSGPPVSIDANHAEAIGLALHELATNSTKYGALSVPSGTVTVAWQIAPNGSGRSLLLDWKEAGGPRVVPPANRGFGSQVIENMVARTVGGEANIQYLPDGIVWHLECQLK